MKKYILFVFIVFNLAQSLTPIEKNGYKSLTSNDEIIKYCNEIVKTSEVITMDTIGISAGNKSIPVLKISNNIKGNKLNILLFAQQHGNEHSGKEALLKIINDFSENKLSHFLDRMNLMIIPSLNPDGSDVDKRMNGNNKDLNRDHLFLSQPETVLLHKLFNKYLPEATLDIHEYYPYGEEWVKKGYRKNYDIQAGILTNINIDKKLVDFQKQRFLTYLNKSLSKQNISFHEYMVGGPDCVSPVRYSTTDINDGRQSFGITNTFSVIYEGIKGRDSEDGIKRRTDCQYEAVKLYLNFIYSFHKELRNIVTRARKQITGDGGKFVHINTDYCSPRPKKIKYTSVTTGADTLLLVEKFQEKVISRKKIKTPAAYLVECKDNQIISLLDNHNIVYKVYQPRPNDVISEYHIEKADKIKWENIDITVPVVKKKRVPGLADRQYYFIPVQQLNKTKIVLLFEPESLYGVYQNPSFREKILVNSEYKILRLE